MEPTRIASTITVASAVKPRREVAVTSPTKGQVGAVHMQPGETVAAGQPLLDLDLTEVRIRQRKAQAAHLKAAAQMEELENWADSVDASKARRAVAKASRGNLPTFAITAVVDRLDARERSAVRLGMSASMEIVVYENHEALVVPVRAVDLTEDRPRVRVRDGTAEDARLVYVTTGITTVDSDEIRSGIAPGDEVAVP